jgi:hypothetical protein
MNQNIWGPHLWFSLHTISFNYPIKPTKEDKENYKNFFIALKNVVPCSICKKNYIRHLNELPIDNVLDDRKSLVNWMIDLHNMVNGETGKKIMSNEAVIKKYEDVYNKKIILETNDKEHYENENENEKENENENENEKKINNNKIIVYYLFIFFLILLLINFIILFYKHK